MMYDIIISENVFFPFLSVQRKKMSQRFNKSPLSASLSKTYIFGAQKHCTCVDGRLKQRKMLCFQKYPATCGQGLNDNITSGFSPS